LFDGTVPTLLRQTRKITESSFSIIGSPSNKRVYPKVSGLAAWSKNYKW